MLPLILKNSAFPCIIAVFLNKILLEIRTFFNFLKLFNSSGIKPFYCRLFDMEFHLYKGAYDMLHICTIFDQMASLDDATLK